MPGAVTPDWIDKPKSEWFENTYAQIHQNAHGHQEYVDKQNAEKVCADITFGFVAIDNDEGRKIACATMADAGIPFVDVGISLDRKDGQVSASIRVTTNRPYESTWRRAIPMVDKTGQETYGKLELPDVAAIAAGLAVQSWRKVRGQFSKERAIECLVYHTDTDAITVRAGGSE